MTRTAKRKLQRLNGMCKSLNLIRKVAAGGKTLKCDVNLRTLQQRT